MACAGNFFFQAEDGIRDGHVTGVQTCALPISNRAQDAWTRIAAVEIVDGALAESLYRSEERRVGKECRSQWTRCSQKKHKLYRLEWWCHNSDTKQGAGAMRIKW